MKNIDYSIYLVTDSKLITGSLENAVLESIKGGVKLIQLREKDISTLEFIDLAKKIKEICHQNDVKFLINDRVDVAIAVDADGVHLGQSDMPCDIARKILGDDKIIGISTQDVTMAKNAEKMGADYIGVGAIFPTKTKDIVKNTGIEMLKEITSSVNIPVVAIGGINRNTVDHLKNIDVAGYAIVTGILMSDDKKAETEYLLSKYHENTRSFNEK